MKHGTIVAAFGRQFEVLDQDGARWRCVTRGKRNDYACGDEVAFAPTSEGEGVIQRAQARRSLLHRSDAFKSKLLAANVTQIFIVVATEPGFSDELISRCLCAADDQHLKAHIVLNKVDLTERLPDARARLELFSRLGYTVVEIAAHDDTTALEPLLTGETSILVGQSGMGKSTLTNALVPEANAATREISDVLDSGKHTTTATRLYPLECGGALIDSPGLQAFGLAHFDQNALAESFREFQPYLNQCRFRDCRHEHEPGCALREAVAAGHIAERRFAHYRQLRDEIAQAKRQAQGW